MRSWRLALVVLTATLTGVAATVLAVAVTVATGGGTAPWFPTMDRHPLRWTAGASATGILAALLGWAAKRWYERSLKAKVPAVQRPEPWVVDRPARWIRSCPRCARRGGTVGITTAVHGAGGFGKTTVAKMVRADRRVLRRFKGRVYWVTLGRDVTKQALAGLVNGLIGQLEPGQTVTFTDPRQAGQQLAAMLAAGPRRLLVLDDVWSDEHLAAFPAAGRCARLVTTRIPSLAGTATVPVRVDQMSQEQALKLLRGWAAAPPDRTGAPGSSKRRAGGRCCCGLSTRSSRTRPRRRPTFREPQVNYWHPPSSGDVLQVDQLTGAAGQQLDVNDPDQPQAVRATIQASTSLLGPDEHERFAELAIFAGGETIPVALVAALWQTTGGRTRWPRGRCAPDWPTWPW